MLHAYSREHLDIFVLLCPYAICSSLENSNITWGFLILCYRISLVSLDNNISVDCVVCTQICSASAFMNWTILAAFLKYAGLSWSYLSYIFFLSFLLTMTNSLGIAF